DGNGDPVELTCKSARSEKKEAARGEFLAVEAIRDVADGNHATATKDDAFDSGRFVRKAKDAAGRDELGDLRSVHGKAALTEADKHKGLRGLGCADGSAYRSGRHWSCAPEVSAPMARVSAASWAASRRVSSSSERKPAGWTTGITVWSRAVRPRYQE